MVSNGTFTFGGVRRGRYRLRVKDDDDTRLQYETTEVDVAARTTDVGPISVH